MKTFRRFAAPGAEVIGQASSSSFKCCVGGGKRGASFSGAPGQGSRAEHDAAAVGKLEEIVRSWGFMRIDSVDNEVDVTAGATQGTLLALSAPMLTGLICRSNLIAICFCNFAKFSAPRTSPQRALSPHVQTMWCTVPAATASKNAAMAAVSLPSTLLVRTQEGSEGLISARADSSFRASRPMIQGAPPLGGRGGGSGGPGGEGA